VAASVSAHSGGLRHCTGADGTSLLLPLPRRPIVGPDGQISNDGVLVGEVDAAVSLSRSGLLSADLKRDGGRVPGQIKTTRDIQNSGTTVALDVTLDAPVVALTKK